MHRLLVLLAVLPSFLQGQIPGSWQVDVHNYEHTMTLTSQLTVNGELLVDTDNVIAAFYGDECRGVVEATQVGESVLYFLLVYGNAESDSLNFKVWDSVVDNVFDLEQQVTFLSGAAYGNVEDPFQLSGTNPISFVQAYDDAYTVNEDETHTQALDILENDVITETLPLVVVFTQPPRHGFLLENIDQTFSYVSDEHFFGIDSFMYEVSHEFGSDSAMVRLTIEAVDDPLTDFTLLEPPDGTVFEANADSLQTFRWERPIDVDGDPVSYTLSIEDGETDRTYHSEDTLVAVNIEELTREVWLTWSVMAFDAWGWTESLDTFTTFVSELVPVNGAKIQPTHFQCQQNYPNPFNPSTTVKYQVAQAGIVSFTLTDLKGNQRLLSHRGHGDQGEYVREIDFMSYPLSNCGSGVYILNIKFCGNDGTVDNHTLKLLYLK